MKPVTIKRLGLGLFLGLLSLPLLSSPLLAAASSDPVADALATELRRSMEKLKLDSSLPPYFISYDLYEIEHVTIQATLGAVVLHERQPDRSLGVAVRVGSPKQDNSNFRKDWNGDDGFGGDSLVLGEEPVSIQRDAWLLTDDCYKSALLNLARKEATRKSQRRHDPPADFAPGKAEIVSLPPAPAPEDAPLLSLARELSQRFRTHPDIESSLVIIAAEGGRRLLLDSGGTRVSKPRSELDIRIMAATRAEDGTRSVDHASWILSSAADLPPKEVMERETDALITRMKAWRKATVSTEEYIGPVLFEGEAAIDLWARLLTPSLSGTPPVEEVNSLGMQDDDVVPGGSLRRRLLPPGWGAWDDPTAEPALASSFLWDDEGRPAQRVDLIHEGIVTGLLGSRTPGRGQPESNGHARSSSGQLARGLPSLLVVEPPRARSPRKLNSKLNAAALDAGKLVGMDHVLVIRRLRDPTAMPDGSFQTMLMGASGGGGALPAPVDMVFRYADGHEVPLRGLDFADADTRSLRGILAAGSTVQGTRMLGFDGSFDQEDPVSGLPTTYRVPEVLIDELRLSPSEGRVDPPLPLPSPLR